MGDMFIYQNKELTVNVENFHNKEKLYSVFDSTMFLVLDCEDIIEDAICKYFEIKYVDDYVESENLNEAIRRYVIDNRLDIEKVILKGDKL